MRAALASRAVDYRVLGIVLADGRQAWFDPLDVDEPDPQLVVLVEEAKRTAQQPQTVEPEEWVDTLIGRTPYMLQWDELEVSETGAPEDILQGVLKRRT